MNKSKFVLKLLPLLIMAGFLSACGDEKPEVLISSAKINIEKNDQKTAIIQIKNALQSNPNLPEARFLLGVALLKNDDPAAAEIEFEKSIRLKYSDDLVVPRLVQSLLMQGKFKKITDDFSKTELQSVASKADLQISLSKAYAAQGKMDFSRSALSSALSYEPENSDALIMKSRDFAAKNDFATAMSQIDAVILKNPGNPEALKTKGDILLFGRNNLDGALLAYKKSIEVKNDYIPSYVGVLTILFQQEKLDEAQKELDLLKKIAERSPQTKYFEVQLAYQKKDYLAARALVQQLLKMSPNNPIALQSAGLIEFQLQSFLQAEIYLSKAIATNSALTVARRLLVVTYMRMGQPGKALVSLGPGLAQEPVDTALYSIAGEVFLQNGDLKKAGEYFSKASKLDPKDARKRTSLALVNMMSGDTTSAFNELDDIASSDQGVTANLALVSAHLRRKDFDKALKAIDGMEKKQPDNPFVFNLRGKVLISKNDYVNARKNFEKAVAINPMYFSAVASLAGLDIFEKKPENAKRRLEDLLAKDPKNNQALLGLAELQERTGGSKDQIADLINRAVTANPSEIGPRILLVDFYLRNKDSKAAFTAAQNAATVLPDSMEVLDALGRAQLASGDTNQAISSYTKLVGLQPQSVSALMRLAGANLAGKNTAAAEQNLTKALGLKPDLVAAQSNLIMLNISAERYPKAIDIARTIQKQRPNEAIGYVLEGDVNFAQKKWDDALAAYRAGLKQSSSFETAIKIHAALSSSDRKVEADKFSVTWMKDHPKDIQFFTYMGDAALVKKDFINAEKYYELVTQAQPENAIAFNNLAWIAGQLKKDGAITYSEKANKLAPNQPAFMDTLAMLLSVKGDNSKAIELQNRVIVLQPDNPIFKLNLAKIYIRSGDKKQAKLLLDDLVKLGDKFSAQAEVDAVLKSL
nr:XrtA/PEP-CTERM system TPR-repeat protein PrsT [uncultured Albidiferax sp.]